MRVSTGADVSSPPSIEQSAMISGRGCGRGRGRDRGRDFRGRGREFVESEHGSYESRQSASVKGPC